jgi:hypothetical protein
MDKRHDRQENRRHPGHGLHAKHLFLLKVGRQRSGSGAVGERRRSLPGVSGPRAASFSRWLDGAGTTETLLWPPEAPLPPNQTAAARELHHTLKGSRLLRYFAATRPVEHTPQRQIVANIFELMLAPRRYQQEVAGLE